MPAAANSARATVRRAAQPARAWCCSTPRGFSMMESLLAVALLATTAAMASPSILRGLDAARGMAAARHVAALVRLTRVQAVMRSTTAGLRFEQIGDVFEYAVFVDENGYGLRSQDVRHRIDRYFPAPAGAPKLHLPGRVAPTRIVRSGRTS